MANESLYNQLLSQLIRTTSGAFTTANLGGYGALGNNSKMPTETLIKPTADTDTKASSFSAKITATGINFGKPSQSVQSVSNGSTNWGQLVSSVASNGLTSLLGGGIGSLGLGSIVSGLLGLFGGGSKSLPALPLFELPASQDVTAYVGNSGSTVYQGSMEQTVAPKSQSLVYSNASNRATPVGSASTSIEPSTNGQNNTTPSGSQQKSVVSHINTSASTTGANLHPPQSASTLPSAASVAPTDVNSQWFMERSSDIAAAVRNAMLNSSSLNDVVAEI